MHDLNWAQTDFTEQSQAFAEKIFADVRLLSQSPAPLTGVTRTSYSPEEGRVLKYLSDVCCGLGLQVETDPAGNVWGTLRGSDPELPAVVSGSHCDSVPDGGNYDGLAGIVAALCTARWMQYLGFSPKRTFALSSCAEKRKVSSVHSVCWDNSLKTISAAVCGLVQPVQR